MLAIASCSKDDDEITPEEQAKLDADLIVEFMKSSKLVPHYVGETIHNIEWKVVDITEDDPADIETLYDLMSSSYVDTTINNVNYRVYYHIFEDTGAGANVQDIQDAIEEEYRGYSKMQVDYQAFLMGYDSPLDYSELFTRSFSIGSLYPAWQIIIPYFNIGLKGSDFPQPCDCDPYRKQIDKPGRGIILTPSFLANGSSNMLFNIVLYDFTPIEIE
jgi:hypothetical protein